MFSDEANFNNQGQINRHNYHYWSNQNPYWHRQIRHQHQWSFNVWCGLVNGYVVGPHFFDGHLTANRYNNFLQNELPVLLENVDLHTRQRLWFQQDGAPANSALCRHLGIGDLSDNGDELPSPMIIPTAAVLRIADVAALHARLVSPNDCFRRRRHSISASDLACFDPNRSCTLPYARSFQ